MGWCNRICAVIYLVVVFVGGLAAWVAYTRLIALESDVEGGPATKSE